MVEEVGNVDSEHGSMSRECDTEDGNYKDTEGDRNGEQSETSEA
jgi:hypothetical protein